MGPDPQMTSIAQHRHGKPVITAALVLQCPVCEVTWRDHVGAPCWSCGKTGVVANPDRLVLD